MSLENLYILKYVLKGNVIWYIWPLNIIGIYFKESHSYHAQKSAYCSASLFPKSRICPWTRPRFRALGISLNKYGFSMNSAVSVSISSSLISLYFFLVFVQLQFFFQTNNICQIWFSRDQNYTLNDYEQLRTWLRPCF